MSDSEQRSLYWRTGVTNLHEATVTMKRLKLLLHLTIFFLFAQGKFLHFALTLQGCSFLDAFLTSSPSVIIFFSSLSSSHPLTKSVSIVFCDEIQHELQSLYYSASTVFTTWAEVQILTCSHLTDWQERGREEEGERKTNDLPSKDHSGDHREDEEK